MRAAGYRDLFVPGWSGAGSWWGSAPGPVLMGFLTLQIHPADSCSPS